MQPNTTCEHCGTPFFVKPYRLREGNGKYCTYACYTAARIADNPSVICENCGKVTILRPSRITLGQNLRFCSHQCREIMREAERIPVEERFWAFVKKSTPDGCWEWQGSKDPKGYGRFGPHPGKIVFAHRYAMRLHLQQDPGKNYVCHSCDNPSCVNPAHLSMGSQSDNQRDMHFKGRGAAAKITWQDAEEIQRLRNSGKTAKELAALYGLSAAHIHRIVSGKAWKDYSKTPSSSVGGAT